MFTITRFTEKAYRAIDNAQKIAGVSVQEMLGTIDLKPIKPEHILSGLLSADADLFRQLSPTRKGIISDLFNSLEPYALEHQEYLLCVTEPMFSTSGKEVMRLAAKQSSQLWQKHIATEHLLLGLLESKQYRLFGIITLGSSAVSKILTEHGFDVKEVRAHVKNGSITPQTTGVSQGTILMGKTLRNAYKRIGLMP
jgi:ATP-dependent Clp protease ATP-binding subunit ClpA